MEVLPCQPNQQRLGCWLHSIPCRALCIISKLANPKSNPPVRAATMPRHLTHLPLSFSSLSTRPNQTDGEGRDGGREKTPSALFRSNAPRRREEDDHRGSVVFLLVVFAHRTSFFPFFSEEILLSFLAYRYSAVRYSLVRSDRLSEP